MTPISGLPIISSSYKTELLFTTATLHDNFMSKTVVQVDLSHKHSNTDENSVLQTVIPPLIMRKKCNHISVDL